MKKIFTSLAVAAAIVLVLVFGSMIFLNRATMHGKVLIVPDFTNMTVAEAEALATFADSSDCPVWCESAMKAAATYGLIPARNGILSYSDKLTRGEAAVLVNALYKMN